MSALLLFPLFAFTGLAVDLGAWYARAAEIQRATDAAALAGVAYMPLNDGQAQDMALAVAEQNGFADGDGVTVVATPLPNDRMRVEITDTRVPQYFTRLFREDVSVSRSSVAEYVPPIRMGSPRNFLGTGDLDQGSGPSQSGLPAGALKEEFFLSVNGRCDRAEDGDLRQSQRQGNNTASNKCTGGQINRQYLPTGYAYGIRAPAGFGTRSVYLEIFDAPYCPPAVGGSHDLRISSSTFTTTFRLREPHPDPFQGAVLQTIEVSTADCGTHGNRWHAFTPFTMSAGQTYVVQVTSSTHSNTSNLAGANNFALRAHTNSSFQACSSDPQEGESVLTPAQTGIPLSACLNVFALEDLSVFVGSAASTAEFFLASIGPEHSGRTLIIDLFDPGEGGETIQIADPNGNLVGPGNQIGDGFGNLIPGVTHFRRSVVSRFDGEATPHAGWATVNEHTVQVNQSGAAPGTGRASDTRCAEYHATLRPACQFNERTLRIEVDLPDNIFAAYGGRTWWRIRYVFGGAVTDRTTWSVRVEGGPVRLIE